jgi:glycosyltransferase involved in cell wall biosynthesis
MRVLHVIPSLSPKHGGPSVALPLMAQSLVRAGVGIDVATTDDDGPGCRVAVPLGQRVERAGYGVYYFAKQSEFYKASWSLCRWLGRHVAAYDLVHIHALFSFASTCAAGLAQRVGVPYVVRPLGVLNRWGMHNRRPRLKSWSFRLVEGPILRRAAAVHYTSRQEQREAEEAGVRTRSALIPLGIDLKPFERLPDKGLFLARFPEAMGRPIVLFLSRLDAKKGLDLLLAAFAEVHCRRPNTLLVIAGGGDKAGVARERELARRLAIGSHVLWTGPLEGEVKLAALAAAQVFVLPSYSENFGLALVEAMAAGLPCLTSTEVGIAPDISAANAGLVARCKVAALAQALERLLTDAELARSLRAGARRLARERFSLEAMGQRLKELYHEIFTCPRSAVA